MIDIKADIEAVFEGGEKPSMMEPLLVSENSKHRRELTDLAVDLAAHSAGFRRSLPAGILAALADLVRSMNCLQQLDRRPRHPSHRYRAGAQERLQRQYANDNRVSITGSGLAITHMVRHKCLNARPGIILLWCRSLQQEI